MPASNERPVALVTGAARRVGAVIARTLHAEGYDVALHCRSSAAEAWSLAEGMERDRAGSSAVFRADLTDLTALPVLIEQVLARFGRLDALVNNASTFYPTPVMSAAAAQWDDLFATNARAPFFLAQAALPALRASSGSIVNICDIYAERSLPDHPLYCMAKAALAAMTRALAVDLAPTVRVNAVAPGALLLPPEGVPCADDPGLAARTPMGPTGDPADAAGAVLWLLRGASYVTGQTIRVDGGRSLLI